MEEDEEESNKEVDNKSFYELLDLAPGVATTTDDVKKAFRKKAIREHPDKGGDPEKVYYSIILRKV
jgi:DnaJ family protein A protein 2